MDDDKDDKKGGKKAKKNTGGKSSNVNGNTVRPNLLCNADKTDSKSD